MRGIERFVMNGLFDPFVPRKKELITELLGAGSFLTSIWGGAESAASARRAQAALRADKARENAGYLRRYNQDVTDTASGQNLLRRASEIYDRDVRRTQGAKAVAGGTDAAVQMAKDARNKAVGDTIADMKAMDDARKDRLDAQHDAAQRNYTQQEMAIENQKAASITNAAQNASNAMMQMAGSFENNTNLQGGDNKSTPVVDTQRLESMKGSHGNLTKGLEQPKSVLNGGIKLKDPELIGLT
jgi:hypothetical protein